MDGTTFTVTVDVSNLDLNTVLELGYDEDGACFPTGTLGDRVAAALVKKAAADGLYKGLAGRVQELRDEMIRGYLEPLLREAFAKPLRQTNTYGEPSGPETTLRELVVAEAKRQVTAKPDRYTSREEGTVLQIEVRKQVAAALAAEVKEAVEQVRAAAAASVGDLVAKAVTSGLK